MLMKHRANSDNPDRCSAADPARRPAFAHRSGSTAEPLDALAPVVHQCIRQFGPEMTLATLAALFVQEAIEWRQPYAMALVLDMDAELLRNATWDEKLDRR